MSERNIDTKSQVFAQSVIGFVEDLFTASPKETFSRVEVLRVLNNVRTNSDIFSPEAMIMYDEASRIVEQQEG